MSLLMTAVLGSVLVLGGALFLFWSYWAVRISVNETRKITKKFRRSEIFADEVRDREPIGV